MSSPNVTSMTPEAITARLKKTAALTRVCRALKARSPITSVAILAPAAAAKPLSDQK